MNNNNKKIICFICSQEFPDIISWKNHIINKHILLEEYLLCPNCQIPCRDIISHYKVHHKNEEIPKLDTYRVKKIYDWELKYTKELRKKNKWKEGIFDSIKMGKKIHYRSSWERDVMICLEKCIDIKEYYGDDYLCITYYLHGSQHRYWPDFTIKTTNNEVIVLEIKPENQTELIINQAKWKSALDFCNKRQWQFQVWTQKHIRKIKSRAIRKDILLREHILPSEEEIIKEININ